MRLRVPWRASADLSCAEVGRMVQGYLDGELRTDDAAVVGLHLDACRRCGLDAEVYRRLKAALVRTGEGAVDEEALRRLRRFGERLAAGEIAEA